jgi:hypothetical protein
MATHFEFTDRVGNSVNLPANAGESIAQVLMRAFIPPLSVTVSSEGRQLADSHRIEQGRSYQARLIEGYDLGTIQRLYADYPDTGEVAYLKRRLVFTDDGHLTIEQQPLTLPETAEWVENMIRQTIRRYALIQPDDTVVLGLSGGVDSGSLMLALGALLERADVNFRLIAATFQDYDSRYTDTWDRSHALTTRFGARHELVGEELAQEVFHLDRPLRQVLPALMETEDAHQTMYVDHHTTRRTLEVFAASEGSHKIALGLHTTDLLAGLVNAQTTGYQLGGLPLRHVGDFDYIFPLTFVPKKELELYHLHSTGTKPKHSPPNPWEFNPLDRNFYYYFADFMQSFWPGVEYWMFTSPTLQSADPSEKVAFVACGNCGGALNPQGREWNAGDFCDVCSILARYGYVKGV